MNDVEGSDLESLMGRSNAPAGRSQALILAFLDAGRGGV